MYTYHLLKMQKAQSQATMKRGPKIIYFRTRKHFCDLLANANTIKRLATLAVGERKYTIRVPKSAIAQLRASGTRRTAG